MRAVKIMQVEELDDAEDFYVMRDLWEKTLHRSLENNIFLTWEKTAPSIEHLTDKSSLRILCATENDKLVGIAPFRKTQKRLRYIRYNIIEPVTNGNTDYAGIILTEEGEKCLSRFLEHLLKQKDWDLFYLPDLPQGSPTLKLIESSRRDLPRLDIRKGWICPYVTIPNSKEELLANLNPKFRRELNRRLRKLEKEQGRVELKPYYALGSLESAMNLLFELHQKRWTLRSKAGVFASEHSRNIVMQTAKFFAEKNWFRLYFLTVNGKPVAAEYDLEYGGKMHGHLCGFDPDYSKYSVGNLLLWKVLEECVEKGISEYDFMQGDESYKFDWTDKQRQNINVRFVNNKPSSKLISLAIDALGISKSYVRKIIPNRNLATATSHVIGKVFRLP